MLTMYLANPSANFFQVGTLVDPETLYHNFFLPWATYRSGLMLFLMVWRLRQVSANSFICSHQSLQIILARGVRK